MTIAEIYLAAENLINQIIRKELDDQGHYLTGALSESLRATISKTPRADLMEGFAAHYVQYTEGGFPASSASYKQVPFLIEYWKKRGLDDKEATRAAFATVKTWMRTGMPTPGSHAFSKTGARKNAIENAFVGSSTQLDGFMTENFDFAVEEAFQKEKSETV